HVRDLQLTARGRVQRGDDVEHVRRVAVETHDRMRRRRFVEPHVDDPGLLDDVRDLAVIAVDDDSEVLWIVDLLDEDPRTGWALRPFVEARGLRELEDVVSEHYDERSTRCEVPSHADDLGKTAGLRLD